MTKKPHVSIIILNWNGWKDTIECLESVLKSDYQKFNIILLDNNSADGSVDEIQIWAKSKNYKNLKTSFPNLVYPIHNNPIKIYDFSYKTSLVSSENTISIYKNNINNQDILFLKNEDNLGFAIAINRGIKTSIDLFGSKYLYLLNNDTVIEKNAISQIITELQNHVKPILVTSAIYDYYNPTNTANLGGKVRYYGKKTYYTKPQNESSSHRVSFVTGCALMIPLSIIETYGYLSEKFFFGEEDYELSLRMKKNNIMMICLFDSKVYHKVSVASKKLLKEGYQRQFVYLFNRIVNLKDYYPFIIWKLWRIGFLFYSAIWLTMKYSVSIKSSLKFVHQLYLYSTIYNDSKKETIDDIIKNISF